MDLYPYEGVDYVHDLDSDGDWPIEDDRYSYILVRHVIEHLRDLRKCFGELHRIARHGATVRIETPHYSSRNSWADPTHVQHLSVSFCDPFLAGYLGCQFPKFRLKSQRISFGSFLLTWPAQLYCKLAGYESYEKHFAWLVPASSVIVELEVVKSTDAASASQRQAA
jgi:SAM-dependent methyltransferase